jgi:cellulose synthase/poly-beta-1,6-N-acetylglucosamine synthase-like glycosyltransferase
MTLFKRSLASGTQSTIANIDQELPIYSILIPLYNEAFKVKSILNAMKNMNYPKNKLDIKIIIEADDLITLRTLSVENLPPYVHIIKVPYSLPRTKPKALNYAMAYVKGDILTIYDAEDIPDTDQLLKAVAAFSNLPEQFACVQAKLNFYNPKENLLTRFFSLEYSIWFEYLLKGLSLLNLPVTLGGTSNHFKVDKLKEVGYWDASNVTEDADLGIRLYLSGYKVHLIDSTTIEESPTNIAVWLPQRARWIKGFIQTIYVFMRAKKDLTKLNYLQIITVYIFVGLSTYSFFCFPWIILALCFELHKYMYYSWFINSIFAFSYLYIIAYFILIKEKESISQFNKMDWITLIAWPLYFLLHTISSYIAIWEIITSPFKWNKTPHGQNSDLV